MENFTFRNACIAGLVLVFLASIGGGSGSKSDGVFESATKKMDSGRPLNAQEAQRIHDILNWCKQCKNASRHCKH